MGGNVLREVEKKLVVKRTERDNLLELSNLKG